jgi:hypothetical protein
MTVPGIAVFLNAHHVPLSTSTVWSSSTARTRLLAVSTVVESNYNCSDDKRPKQKVTR